jgi:hypothetical protein
MRPGRNARHYSQSDVRDNQESILHGWLPETFVHSWGSPVRFLDPIVIVECKNTGTPVGSQDVGWFVRKLQNRGANVGILVALAGIAGAQAGTRTLTVKS